MNLHEKRKKLVTESLEFLNGLKATGKGMTEDELAWVEGVNAEIEGIDTQLAAAAKSTATIDRLSSFPVNSPEDDEFTPPTYSQAKALAGSPWAKSVTTTMSRASQGIGVKAPLQGEVTVPPAVDIVALPDVPRTLLDLVQRVPLNSNHYSYLSQVAQTENVGVVADDAEKPTSVYTFEEVEGRCRVVAHLSEPFPLRYLEDYKALGQVLDDEMKAGVLRKVEQQLLSGDGVGENFTGILATTGVTDIPFVTDPLTTIRTARTTLAAKGEQPTAWVLHPEDEAELELTREDGATGGFLMINGAYDVLFGEGIARVTSTAIPKGTALLADWSKIGLFVRQAEHTLAATQAGDLFDHNQVKLRSEGRYGIQLMRPQAVGVVHLTA